MFTFVVHLAAALVVCVTGGVASAFDSGSTGADGDLVATGSMTIDMSDHPDGIYHYRSVVIGPAVEVRFTPNEKNTPVTWLVQGDVMISGDIYLNGENGLDYSSPFVQSQLARGGPGGFPGGMGAERYDQSAKVFGTAGQGPGGGPVFSNRGGAGGSYGTDGVYNGGSVYGNEVILPLLGGSGGGGGFCDIRRPALNGGNGGGGGGAILIASSGRITIDGAIYAPGGNGGNGYYRINSYGSGGGGGGSGGAIRLMADRIEGSGVLLATGGLSSEGDPGGYAGGKGRIRLEATDLTFDPTGCNPLPSFSSYPDLVNLPDVLTPRIEIVSVAGVAVPAEPVGELLLPPDVDFNTTEPVEIVVQTTNVPVGTTVTVRAVRQQNSLTQVEGNTRVDGSEVLLVDLPPGKGVIHAWVTYAPEIPGGASLMVNGQEVSSVIVGAGLGGRSGVVYVGADGNMIPESAITEIRLQE
jgi:hypothetical protein